jgi:phospholipid/cholesterol/gamma-HCH transport system substrate-binding protein
VSDYESIQKKRNLIVGAFVVAAVCALFWMVFKFGDLPVVVSEWKSFRVKIQFPTASGVQQNTPVRFCGYQVGRVTEVRPPAILKDLKTGRYYHQTMVIAHIDRRYNDIPADVDVKLMTRGLGSSYIELRISSVDVLEPPKEVLVDGSALQGSTGMTSEFFPEESQKKLDELVAGLNGLIGNANDILGDRENKQNVKTALANLSETTKQAMLTLKEFEEFSSAWVRMSEELSRTTGEVQLILEKINKGEGTAGRLLNDGELYENLLENTQQLQVLLEELKTFFAKANEKGSLPIKLK